MADIAALNAANGFSTETVTDRSKLSSDKDQFLKLLTTQLKNQDPLSPMDTAQFTNQLVAFSQVEQQINTNDKMDSLLAVQSLNMTALGVSFIGKNVEVQGKKFSMDGAKSANLSYTMPQTAKTGSISIKDADGNVVYSKEADLTTGTHEFTWDGKDKNGNMVPAGKYEITVAATTEDGKSLNVATYVPGYVTSLESADDGSLQLNVDGEKIPLGAVRKISQST